MTTPPAAKTVDPKTATREELIDLLMRTFYDVVQLEKRLEARRLVAIGVDTMVTLRTTTPDGNKKGK